MGKGGNKPPDSAYKNASLYPGLRDPVDKAIKDAQGLYKQGWNTTPFTDLQTGAYGGAQGLMAGLDPQLNQGGINFAANVAAGGAMGAPGQGFLQGVYGQPTGGPMQGQLNQLAGGAAGQIDPSLAGIRATAGGANMNVAQNPYLQRAIASGNADITRDYTNAQRPGIEGRFGMSGTAGSPMEGWAQGDAQRNLADRLAANTSNIMMGQYGAERGYQQQAQMGMPGAVGTAYGTAGQAAGQAGQNWLQSLNSQIGAAQGAGQMYGQGVDQALAAGQGLGQQISGQLNPYIQLAGLGSQQQQQQQAMANPQWTALNQYVQMLQGLGGMTNPAAAAQAMQGYQSGGQQGFGNLLALGGLGTGLVGAWRGQTSDRRAKKDVEPVGVGSGLYRWRYKWEDGTTPRHLGPMAQEVAAVAPSAVAELDGLLQIPSVLVER